MKCKSLTATEKKQHNTRRKRRIIKNKKWRQLITIIIIRKRRMEKKENSFNELFGVSWLGGGPVSFDVHPCESILTQTCLGLWNARHPLPPWPRSARRVWEALPVALCRFLRICYRNDLPPPWLAWTPIQTRCRQTLSAVACHFFLSEILVPVVTFQRA